MAKRSRREDLRVQFNETVILGTGFQSVVFAGSYDNQKAAIKRVSKSTELMTRREEGALRTFNHENILKLIDVDEDPNFKYFVLELCAATIVGLCSGQYTGPVPGHAEALYQMANGLLYIHQKEFIHRDIKPENILISFPSVTGRVQLKISDFGFTKHLKRGVSGSMSGVRGTENWFAPELLLLLDNFDSLVARCDVRSDIFSMGCVFGYFLTRGTHPFGKILCKIMNQIYEGQYDLSDITEAPYRQIVESMIQYHCEQRTSLESVCNLLQPYLMPSADSSPASNRHFAVVTKRQHSSP